MVLGDADRVVAMGAGAYAGIRTRREEIRDMLLTDVCPFTLGIGVAGKTEQNVLSPMIERNSTLPASCRNRFVTACDYQREILVKIYQGEEYYVDNNVFLGEVSIEVAPKPRGQAWIEVQFTYDINGILHVAVVNELGEKKQLLLASQTLSEAELAHYAGELEKLMVPPLEEPENRALLDRLLEYYEEAVGRRRELLGAMIGRFTMGLNSGRRRAVKDAVETAEEWLAWLAGQKDMQEERLFDGELKAWRMSEGEEEEEEETADEGNLGAFED